MRFPLAHRELTRQARSRHLHWTRGLIIGAVAGLLLVEWISYLRSGLLYRPDYLGTLLHVYCLIVQAAILTIVLPVLAAPALASERGEGTLSLLLIADFRGWDILAAKSLAVMMEAGLLLFALVPLHFMSTLFGGVSPAVIAMQTVAIAVLCLFTLMTSMLCSCLVRNTTSSIVLALSVNVVAVVAWLCLDLAVFRGALGFNALRALFFEFHAPVDMACRRAIAVLAVAALACGAVVLWLLPRLAVERPRHYWVGAPTPYGHTSRRLLRWGAVQPMVSVHGSGLTSVLRSPAARIAMALGLLGMSVVPLLGGIVVVTLLIHDVTASVVATRRSGALDDLRVAIREPELLERDLFAFYWTRAAVFLPALMMCAIHLVVLADSVRLGPIDAVGPLLRADVGWAAYPLSLIAIVVAFGYAQRYAIVSISSFAAFQGDSVRRQVAAAIFLIGLIYVFCGYAAHGQDYLVKFVHAGDMWFRVPLFMTCCIGLFAVVGWAARAGIRRHLNGGADAWTGVERGRPSSTARIISAP